MRYLAFLHIDETGSVGISFPDFPGCVSVGDDTDDAIARGEAALALHVEGLLKESAPLPAPRTAAEVMADPDLAAWRAEAHIAWVPLILDRGSPRRVNVSLDPGLLDAIDAETRRRGMNRSAFSPRPRGRKSAVGTESRRQSQPTG